MAERELGGEDGGVRAARAVDGAVGVARTGYLEDLAIGCALAEQIDGLRAVTAGEHDDLGTERE